MTVSRGTIVYGDDPFKGEDATRPWVVISTTEMPFHGDQYVALTLTTKTWYDEHLPINETDLVDGGLPEQSSILPWAVASLSPDHITRELGQLDDSTVNEAVLELVSYLGVGSLE
ncbi:type II toxin-antitoxin system PemK/MazF family toxin [Halostagnicola bangensis]